MEPFESRITRLTPDQRREVEDFIDFLIAKNEARPVPVLIPQPTVLPNMPPVLTADPTPSSMIPPVRLQDPVAHDEPPAISELADTTVHEINIGGDDWVTRDYMDYGKFESESSPATEAVKKVKHKIITRQAEDKSRHLLDWVD